MLPIPWRLSALNRKLGHVGLFGMEASFVCVVGANRVHVGYRLAGERDGGPEASGHGVAVDEGKSDRKA